MSKILITGGAGFLGFNLAKHLVKKKHKVFLLDNFSRGKLDYAFESLIKYKNIKLIKKDLLNLKFFKEQFDIIFHLASIVGVKNVNKNPTNTFYINLVSTLNLLRTVKNKKKTKFIFFSTSEVYSPLIENKKQFTSSQEKNSLLILNKTRPRDSYYLSKLTNEKIVTLSGLNYIIFRPHNIYGPRMGFSHVIPELIYKIKRKKICKIYSPSHSRAFCYIDDAVNQILKLSFSNKYYNSIYNIGNMKEEIKIFELAKMIKNIVNQKCLIKKFKNTPGSPRRRVPNMRKTLQNLKNFKFTDLKSGLLKTVEWYLNEKY